MTTLDKTPHPGPDRRPAAATPAHDPTTPFYAVGGSDPDFALPSRGGSKPFSLWARLLSPTRRK